MEYVLSYNKITFIAGTQQESDDLVSKYNHAIKLESPFVLNGEKTSWFFMPEFVIERENMIITNIQLVKNHSYQTKMKALNYSILHVWFTVIHSDRVYIPKEDDTVIDLSESMRIKKETQLNEEYWKDQIKKQHESKKMAELTKKALEDHGLHMDQDGNVIDRDDGQMHIESNDGVIKTEHSEVEVKSHRLKGEHVDQVMFDETVAESFGFVDGDENDDDTIIHYGGGSIPDWFLGPVTKDKRWASDGHHPHGEVEQSGDVENIPYRRSGRKFPPKKNRVSNGDTDLKS